MSTITQGTCDELKIVGMMSACTMIGTTGLGALTTITAAGGATYGALLVGSFALARGVIGYFCSEVDDKVRMVVSFLFATVVAALLTPVLTGAAITIGSAVMLDAAGIASMLVLMSLTDCICGYKDTP